MDTEIQSLLKSPLADDRKRGVQTLAKSGDPNTLKILSALIKREKDPEVKQVIARAGKALQQRGGAAPASDKSKSKSTSNDPNKSSMLLEQAQDAMIDVDYIKAKDLARQAYALNPDIQYDDDARRLLADIFTTSPEDAIAMLESGGASRAADDWDDYGSAAGKPKRKSAGGDDTSWNDALLDVGIYGLFSGGLLFLGMLFLVFVIGGAIQLIANAPTTGADAMTLEMMSEMAAVINSAGFAFALVYGVFAAIGSIIGYFIMFGLIHFVSTMWLGGRGTYPGVLHRAFIPMLVGLIANYVLGGIALYMMFSSFAYAITTNDLSGVSGAYNLVSLLNLILGIGFAFWLAAAIGDNYNFGMGKGCASIILSYVVIFALACGCSFALSFIAGSAAQSTYPGLILIGF